MSAFPCPRCDAEVAAAADACPSCGGSLVVLGRYRIDELLGQGGMGRVYGALARPGREPVAVKVLTLEDGVGWSSRELFESSTRLLQGLRHAGLPKVHAFTQDDDGRLWLVRERFDGGTLEERVKRDHRRLLAADFRALLVRLLEIFAYLHRLVPPVLHRDVKPANIMFRGFDDWSPVLVDFDTAAAPAVRSGSTIIGTLGYAAPEQLAAEYSPASDLYGLGTCMLFLATHVDAVNLPRKGGRFDVDAALSGVDPDVREVVRKLVEPEPRDRFQSAQDALEALARRPPAKQEAPPAKKSSAGAAIVGAVSTLLLSGGAVFLLVKGEEKVQQWVTGPSSTSAPGTVAPKPPTAPPPRRAETAEAPADDPSKDDEDDGDSPSPRKRATRSSADVPAQKKRSASAPARPERTFARGACAGMLACYDRQKVYGQVSGRVVSEIDQNGAATGARYEAGQAPQAVQDCLLRIARNRRIDGFWGDPGELACEYLGRYVPGAPVVSLRTSFKRTR